MMLRDLVPPDAAIEPRFAALTIGGVATDSRRVKPGDLFVAVTGTHADGLAYVQAAVEAGAVAVMAERMPQGLPTDIAVVVVKAVRPALAQVAARFYPQQPATIAAVTGTSGKTSVAAFTRQIWSALGHAAASIGTIGVVAPSGEVYGSLTTPDPVDLHRTLDQLAREGVTHLALEASSHGLDQHRLDGVHIQAAAFTNLSHDHLDYHGTRESYLAAKLRLFDDLVPSDGAAVVAADGDAAEDVIAVARRRGLAVLTVGRRGDAIRLIQAEIDGFSQTLEIEHQGSRLRVRLPLVGAFQVENALVAAGLAIAGGGDPDAVFSSLEGLKGAKGRLELVGHRRGAPVFIDYAHKPDALAQTLDALRPYASRQLVVVFGAGGDRDRNKRPMMGAIAAAKADRVIVTDDNPRSEEPAAIRAEILAAAPGAIEIGDRREAIRHAIGLLGPGDTLIVAGKGHETGQTVGNVTLHFSDHEEVRQALKELAS